MPTFATVRNALMAMTLSVPVLLAGSTTFAASAANDPMQMLDDFVHYALVYNPDLARANARKLLDSGITAAELATLLDEGTVTIDRFERAISWSINTPALEDVAGELSTFVEQGRLDMARDGDRIEQAVSMLGGTQRQRMIAQRRLLEAGEYAVPALLRQITTGRDQGLTLASVDIIRQIGPQAVIPLCVALPHLGDATSQRVVCDLLGDLAYPHAAPFLMDIAQQERTSTPVREAARRALGRLDMQNRQDTISAQYTHLARQFFNNASSLIAYELEDTNNVWTYDQFIGLTPTAVRTEIYGQVMAMRMTSRALRLDANNADALSLFVAANLKRQNDLPQGAADPIFGDSDYSPDFYATVFGTSTSLDVLGLAIDIQDTQLIRDAIGSLAKTTGGANLFSYGDGRQPLLEAMRYPDRRVQYESGLTLARALPQQNFAGDYAVVPLLASAIRTGGRLFAVVIGDDAEDRRDMTSRLQSAGFDVIGSESSVAGVRNSIDRAAGVDLVMTRMRSVDRSRAVLNDLRALPATSVAPVLMLSDALDLPELRLEFRNHPRVLVSRPALDSGALSAAIDQLMERAVGGRMTEAEAEVYAIEAIAALRDIAISNSPVYDAADAESALLAALEARRGGLRLHVADILALIDSEQAQHQLFDAALAASGNEQIDLLTRVANSIKRYGSRAQDRHVDALLDLVANSSGRTAEAAAIVHGSMKLPGSSAVGLITQE